MSGFREKTVSGVAWNFAGQAGRQSAVLLSTVILARLLSPRDFGLIATTIIFSNFAFIISEQGFMTALVQREDAPEPYLSSTFWLNIAMGAVLTTVFVAGAPLAASLYGEPLLTPLLRIVSAGFTIFPLGMVHRAILTRRLSFRSIAVAETVGAWVAAAAAVTMAWRGVGVYSIALQFVIEFAVTAASLWLVCAWRPRLLFQWGAIRDLAGFSTSLFLANVAEYWVRNIDNLLIGLTLGAFPLGLYSRAYAIMLFPLTRISQVFSKVMVRAFALIQSEPERVRAVFLEMSGVIALVTFPMMLGVAASAPTFVACVFGSQWTGAVPVLRILAFVGMLQSVTSLTYSLFMSRGRADLNLKVNLPCYLFQAAGIVMGLRGGVVGVAACYCAAFLVTAAVPVHYSGALVGLGAGEFFRSLGGIFACAAAMAAGVASLEVVLPARLPAPARMAVEVLAGGAVYWLLIRAVGLRAYTDLKGMVRERLGAAA